MGAVKDPFSSLLPIAAFDLAQQPYSLLLLNQLLSESHWD